MPIKFRCRHCRQFLGISRSKAGAITDCPACGRTIRVPHLDGRVEPLPEPKIDFEDDDLAKALDAIADLGDGEAVEESRNVHESVSEPEATETPHPVAVEPLPRAIPVDVDQQTDPSDAVAKTEDGSGGSFHADDSDDEVPVEAPPEPAEEVIAELDTEFSDPNSESTRRSSVGQIVAFAMAALAGVVIGFFAGRGTGQPTVTSSSSDSRPSERIGDLYGRVTVRDSDGRQPDAGATVIALPISAADAELIRVDDMASLSERSTAKALDEVRAVVRAAGGDLAVADATGNYQLQLSQSADVWLLVISAARRRDESDPIEEAMIERLAQSFDKPPRLLGRLAYRWTRERVAARPRLLDVHFDSIDE